MTIRVSAFLPAAALIAVLAVTSASAAEFATKDEAVAMVKKAVVFMKEQGTEKAYAEFSTRAASFTTAISTLPFSISMVRFWRTGSAKTSSAKA